MTSTEITRFCPMCASPLRPRAAFCHRCGKPYPEEAAVIYKANESQANVPTTEEFEAQWNTLTNINGGVRAAETENLQALLPETGLEENATGEAAQTEKKQRVRRRVVQTTEYVWDESATDPTGRFVLATVLVLVFVFLVLWFGGFIHF